MNKPKMGIYAGSFSPFTIGHLDIVKQAMPIFDKVLVAQGINPEKLSNGIMLKYPLPVRFLTSLGPEVYSTVYDTLLTDLIKTWESECEVTLVRGLRNGADLEYEQNIVAFLKGMYPQIQVVAFYCDPKFRHISSSALRGIQKFSEDEYKKYVISD